MTVSLRLHDFPFYGESLYSATIKKGPLPIFSLSSVQISVWTYTFPLPSMCFLWVSIYSPPVIFPVLPSTSAYSVSTWNTTYIDSFWHFIFIFFPLIQKIYFLHTAYYPYSEVSLFPKSSCSYKKAVILFVGCLVSSNQPSSGMWG